MCTVCGCAQGNSTIEGRDVTDDAADSAGLTHEHAHVAADGTIYHHRHPADHDHDHDHGHGHGQNDHSSSSTATVTDLHYGHGPARAHIPGMSQTRMVQIERDILAKNDGYAASNRQWFAERGILALNLVSSPGAGKTTLLVRTIEQLRNSVAILVIEGDQQTSNDAERIRATGVPAVQINTGKGCHLDAHMVGHAIERLQPPESSLLLIENVGNLVCPAAFDLGEAHKVVILSVTEGEDKPLKYPDMFAAADVMLLNKCDLLPHLQFDIELAEANARRVNPRLQIIRVSASSGDGMAAWLEWLQSTLKQQQNQRNITVDRLQQRILELERQLAERDAVSQGNQADAAPLHSA